MVVNLILTLLDWHNIVTAIALLRNIVRLQLIVVLITELVVLL